MQRASIKTGSVEVGSVELPARLHLHLASQTHHQSAMRVAEYPFNKEKVGSQADSTARYRGRSKGIASASCEIIC